MHYIPCATSYQSHLIPFTTFQSLHSVHSIPKSFHPSYFIPVISYRLPHTMDTSDQPIHTEVTSSPLNCVMCSTHCVADWQTILILVKTLNLRVKNHWKLITAIRTWTTSLIRTIWYSNSALSAVPLTPTEIFEFQQVIDIGYESWVMIHDL